MNPNDGYVCLISNEADQAGDCAEDKKDGGEVGGGLPQIEVVPDGVTDHDADGDEGGKTHDFAELL